MWATPASASGLLLALCLGSLLTVLGDHRPFWELNKGWPHKRPYYTLSSPTTVFLQLCNCEWGWMLTMITSLLMCAIIDSGLGQLFRGLECVWLPQGPWVWFQAPHGLSYQHHRDWPAVWEVLLKSNNFITYLKLIHTLHYPSPSLSIYMYIWSYTHIFTYISIKKNYCYICLLANS